MESAEITPREPRRVAFYEFELDLSSGDLGRAGEPVRLAAQPAEVLRLLVERAGELVMRSEIQDHVWGDLVIEQEQGLNTCIRQIRTALGDRASPPRFIETVPRRGYRFIAPVSSVGNGTPPDALRWSASLLKDRRAFPAGIALGMLALIAIAQRPWSAATEPATTTEAAAASSLGRSSSIDEAASGIADIHPEAREAYLRARYLLRHGRNQDPAQAQIELRRALDLDPSLALAHVALADAYHLERGPNSSEKQRSALQSALELDSNLPSAHLRLAKIRLYKDWSFEAAGRSFDRAHRLAPDDPEVLRNYALYLAHLRRHDEAIEHIERARRLDPISVAIHGNGAEIYFAARRYEQVVELCRRALELAPDHFHARAYLLHAYHQMGRREQAREQALEVMRQARAADAEQRAVAEDPDVESALQHFFHWQLEWLRARGAPPVGMAAALLPLGRVDEVFVWLEKAYQQHSDDLLLIAGDPRADAFRGDPRFVDLLRRIGFPEETIQR